LKKLKTILLTGATGFLGSHILRSLLVDGYQVIIVKRKESEITRIEDIINQTIVYNIDKTSPISIFKSHIIDAIIHTATSYGRDNELMHDIFQSNFDFPVKLLQAGIQNDLPCFINTDTFFTTDIRLPVGLSDYVLSKKQFVQIAKLMVANTHTHFVNLRLHHLYGPKDRNDKFISFLINSLKNNEEMQLTAGGQQRDYIYVNDAVSAYICILKNYFLFDSPFVSIDLGAGKAVSLKELVQVVHKLVNSSTRLLYGALPYRENEIMYSVADISTLMKMGWKPLISLEEGIRKTIEIS
jgi:CDP-paratose synthetase